MFLENGVLCLNGKEWDAIPDSMKGHVTHEYMSRPLRTMIGFRTLCIERKNKSRVFFEGISMLILDDGGNGTASEML